MQKKYFLGTIGHLVCRKMCCKNFANRLRNKKVWSKYFRIGISCTKISWKGGKYFPAKMLNSYCLIMIAQNHYKMAQMTYPRQNLHDQGKNLEKCAFHDHRSSPLSMQNFYSKLILAIKTLFFHRFSKKLQVILGYTKIKILTRKHFFCRLPYKNG